MTVEMILRLVDQATAPLRGVTAEVEADKAAKDFGKGDAAAGRQVPQWADQQREIKKAERPPATTKSSCATSSRRNAR